MCHGICQVGDDGAGWVDYGCGVLCPACAQHPLAQLADLGEMPVQCGLTFDTAVAARTSPRGRMVLARCPRCGHVANAAFDARLGAFDPSFEAALFHSPTYVRYATGVVDRLVERFGLRGQRVLEVGSGSDVLLERLAAQGCQPTGVAEPDPPVGQFAFALARFVLEHVPDPAALLTRLHGVAERAFIEVPDAGYDLTTAGWDCIYPHVNYFGRASLQDLCARTGWRILDSGLAFHNQYLWAEIERAQTNGAESHGAATKPTDESDPAPGEAAAAAQPLRFAEATAHWQQRLATGRAVVWGAGTRGTMFCNRVDPSGKLIAGVVDRNPGKHGRYLPVSGHRVISPADLADVAPEVVVLTNPAYQTEITAELVDLGVAAQVVAA